MSRSAFLPALCSLVAAIAFHPVATASPDDEPRARRIGWADTAPLHERLTAAGLTPATFDARVEAIAAANVRRVHEGDLDHLIFYALQSTRFTTLPAIEPALSARALVDALTPAERESFLRGSDVAADRIPRSARARIDSLLAALDGDRPDARLEYFRDLLDRTAADPAGRRRAVEQAYLRAMRFVYEKEFVAQRSTDPAGAVAALYRTRGLATDTAVEAGFLVYQGLGLAKALRDGRPVRRALVVGPGLDLAPRTALREDGPPQSYQPWAVIDALLSLGLAHAGDFALVAADINPRVVSHLRRVRHEPPRLLLVSEIVETDTISLAQDYRDYFDRLGRAIGETEPLPESEGTGARLRKALHVRSEAAATLHAASLDIVTERLDGPPFDLVVATNILPYFDDVELTLAMSNIAAMLAPGGVLVHNEGRPMLRDLTDTLGIPFRQSRHAIVATVRGAPAPLFDSVWVHSRVEAGSRQWAVGGERQAGAAGTLVHCIAGRRPYEHP